MILVVAKSQKSIPGDDPESDRLLIEHGCKPVGPGPR